MIFVGDDWSEDKHDLWLMDSDGLRLAATSFSTGIEGIAAFHELTARFVSDPSEVVIGIETDRGLWVTALVAAGYQVFAINPKSMVRYRDRHRVSGAKSDIGDAKVLADVVRTDRHNHRPVAGDSPQAQAVKTLARAHQNLIWDRTRHNNRLRAALIDYYPTALDTFSELSDRDTLAILAKAPTPEQGAKLTRPQIRSALKAAGRRRYLDARTETIHAGLRQPQLHAPTAVAAAKATTVQALIAVITVLNTQIDELETVIAEQLRQHPDAPIYLSLPGIADVLGARTLGEFGDDPNRYLDVKSRRNYAATSPITIASGKSEIITARWIRNERLHDTAMRWAFCSLSTSPGARAFYEHHKQRTGSHNQALRALANRLIGILHGCLKHQTPYNEHTAWAHRNDKAA